MNKCCKCQYQNNSELSIRGAALLSGILDEKVHGFWNLWSRYKSSLRGAIGSRIVSGEAFQYVVLSFGYRASYHSLGFEIAAGFVNIMLFSCRLVAFSLKANRTSVDCFSLVVGDVNAVRSKIARLLLDCQYLRRVNLPKYFLH